MSEQRGGSDLSVNELLERNMELGNALALARHRLRNLLEGLKAENVEHCMQETPERMRVLGAILRTAPEARRTTIDECEKILLALYERGPRGRGSPGWQQAWGMGVLDAADEVRALKSDKSPPQGER